MTQNSYEKPQYCNLSEPEALTILSISLATAGVETNGAMSGTRASATFPTVCDVANNPPSEPFVSFAVFETRYSWNFSSAPGWKTTNGGVVNPMPIQM